MYSILLPISRVWVSAPNYGCTFFFLFCILQGDFSLLADTNSRKKSPPCCRYCSCLYNTIVCYLPVPVSLKTDLLKDGAY